MNKWEQFKKKFKTLRDQVCAAPDSGGLDLIRKMETLIRDVDGPVRDPKDFED